MKHRRWLAAAGEGIEEKGKLAIAAAKSMAAA
jgi:hypothetical protein